VWIFKTGPLAWNGLLGFWIPVSVYFLWVIGTTVMTGRAVSGDNEPKPDLVALADRLAELDAEIATIKSGAQTATR
jgi:hypothetical protein